jgi:hypothetical protein
LKRKTDARLVRTLLEDAIAAGTSSDAPSPASKRNAIRTTIAAVEAIAWLFAEHIASVAHETGNLSAAEQLALSEKSYQVNNRGKVSEQPRFIPLPSLIRLAANIAARVDRTLTVDFNGAGWSQLQIGLAARNRITHPRTFADLDVTETEIAASMDALRWLMEVAEQGMSSTLIILRSFQGQLADIARRLVSGDEDALAEYEAAARRLQDEN